jgi:hypothetical protein
MSTTTPQARRDAALKELAAAEQTRDEAVQQAKALKAFSQASR